MQKSSTLNAALLRSLVSTLPRHLPDAETGRRVGEADKIDGGRALAALKRSVRVIAAARYFSEAGKGTGRSQHYKSGATNSASVEVKIQIINSFDF